MTEADVLASLLSAEHEAVYAYGVLGARLDVRTRALALRAFDAHRVRRNALTVLLTAKGLPVPPAAAAYDVTVADPAAALVLATRVETELGVRWRDLVASTNNAALRQMAVSGLQDSAVRATTWRRIARVTPLTEPFPGLVPPAAG